MIGGKLYFNLPGAWLKEIPLINNLRVPQRWVWPFMLVITVPGVWLISQWCGRNSLPWKPRWEGNKVSYLFPLVLAVVPVVEGRWFPLAEPANYSPGTEVHPVELARGILENHAAGSILVMPAEAVAAEGNILQTLVGHSHHFALGYVARAPLDVHNLPWKWNTWTPEAGAWLKEHNVTMVAFPFHDGKVEEFESWVEEAKKIRPELIVLNRAGDLIPVDPQ